MSSEPKGSQASVLDRSKPPPQPVSGWQRWLAEKLYQGCGSPELRIVLWDGSEISDHAPPSRPALHIREPSALTRIVLHPDLYFGECYTAGAVEVEGDLVSVLREISRARARYARDSKRPIDRLAYRLISRARPNSMADSRANIHHHYDIGNAFYRLWLDREAMQYTCAYYPDADATLEQAQIAKLEHVCRKLRLKPGQQVVEAGCGWGGLARYMAKHYGVHVRAYNISHEQVCFAREQAEKEGVSDRVEYVEDDYRTIHGQFDAFVSVGMLEHVGRENYPTLGGIIRQSLKPEGIGLIHTIGRNWPRGPMNAWIEKHVFPGAYPPTLAEMMAIFEDQELSILDMENLRLHYAQTLHQWLQRFEQNEDRVEQMFDPSFVRTWRLYLAGSIAAFANGDLQLFQAVFSHGRNNAIPMTRAHMYHDAA